MSTDIYPSPDEILSNDFLDKYKGKQPKWGFNGLGLVIFYRTYSRPIYDTNGQYIRNETWAEVVERCIRGAQRIGACYTKEESERLYDYVFNLKCNFAGRSLWQLGTPMVDKFQANSLINCFFTTIESWDDYAFVFENLMLGGGVTGSVRKEHIYQLPKVKSTVEIVHENTKDADFIVPDSRQGWVELLQRVGQSVFQTGKGFRYSTILVRKYGEPIKGFGGTASGPEILINGIQEIVNICNSRAGKKLRSIDALDIFNIIASIVVAGNVRRSAELALGDADDILFLRAKRWDLGNIPNWRAMSNNTIAADSYEYTSNEFWKGYEGNGECYGLFNLWLSQHYGRLIDGPMKDCDLYPQRKDNCEGTNPSLVSGTLIQTQEMGIVPIESLQDKSFTIKSLDGRSAKAKCFLSGLNQETFKISFGKHKFTKATKEHKWPVLRNGKIIKIKTTDLRINDLIPLNRNEETGICGNNLSRDEGFLIGYLLGDGWIGQRESGKYYCGCTFGLHEKNLADKVIKIVNSLKIEKSNLHINHTNEYSFSITDQAFCKLLIDKYKMGLSDDKHIPSTIFESNDECIKGFVDGLISSDGCVDSQTPRILLTTSRKRVATDFAKLLSFYGINCHIKSRKITSASFPNKKKYDRTYKIFNVQINGYQVERFAKIFSLSHIEKQNKIDNRKCLNGYSAVKDFIQITKIEKSSSQDVWDITVYHNEHVFPHQYCYTGNCSEISLANGEVCNLSELYLNNISSKEELIDCAKLLYKTQKAICSMSYLHEKTNKIVHKNMRIGIGVTGICQSLDKIDWLSDCYLAVRKFDKSWSKKRGWPESIKISTIKPSGTLSLLAGATPGVHPAYDKFFIRRIRIGAIDPILNVCKNIGCKIEPVKKFDGSEDINTVVVEFPCEASGVTAKEMSAIEQLELVKKLQTVWADNSVSVTVYFKPEEMDLIKNWLKENYETSLKCVSFLRHQDHGFVQAPYESITQEQYQQRVDSMTISQIASYIDQKNHSEMESVECANGACPVR